MFRKCRNSKSKSSNPIEETEYEYRNVESIPLQHPAGPTSGGMNNLSLYLHSFRNHPSSRSLPFFQSLFTKSKMGKVSPFEICLTFGTIWENTAQIYYSYGSVYDDLEVVHKQTVRLPEDQPIIHMEWFTLKIPEEKQDDPDAFVELTLMLILDTKFLSFYFEDGIKCITRLNLLQDLDLASGNLLKCFTVVDKHLYGGAEFGKVYVFEYFPTEQRVGFLLKYEGLVNGEILAMASNASTIVCACLGGILTYWTAGLSARTTNKSIPPTQGDFEKLYFWGKDTIVCTTNFGFVHIYNIKNHELVQSIQIQLRPLASTIVSTDFLPKRKVAFLLIVGSTGLIQVRKLTSKTKKSSKFLCFNNSQQNQTVLYGTARLLGRVNGVPVGGRFLNSSGKLIGVTSVGEKWLDIYRRRKN